MRLGGRSAVPLSPTSRDAAVAAGQEAFAIAKEAADMGSDLKAWPALA